MSLKIQETGISNVLQYTYSIYTTTRQQPHHSRIDGLSCCDKRAPECTMLCITIFKKLVSFKVVPDHIDCFFNKPESHTLVK